MAPSSSSLPNETILNSSAIYLLNCSVCRQQFVCRKDWLDHLTGDNHQSLGKVDWVKQQNIEKYKEICLVIFTAYDLTTKCADNIIQYFAGGNHATLVTDFMWWEDRPRIGIVQFESRKKADEVLKDVRSILNADLIIDNQEVQVKGGCEILELQWKALLPRTSQSSFVNNSTKLHSCNEKEEQKKKLKALLNLEITNSACPVSVLNAFAKDQGWKIPEFEIKRVRIPGKTVYISTVLVNGITFEPPQDIEICISTRCAKNTAAIFYLQSVNHPFASKLSLLKFVKGDRMENFVNEARQKFNKKYMKLQ